jgi:hypothetical protein
MGNFFSDRSNEPFDPDEEERRRLAQLAEGGQPTRVSTMALPGAPPAAAPDYAGWTPMDTQGRVVPIPTAPQAAALGAFNPEWEGEAGRLEQFNAFSAALDAYNRAPRDERFFQPERTAGSPYGITPGSITVAEEDARIARGELPPIHERGMAAPAAPAAPAQPAPDLADITQRVTNTVLTALGQPPRTADGQVYPQVNEVMSAEEERALAARQQGQPRPAAQQPSFADNEAVLAGIAEGGAPVGQTEPDPDGNTYPVLGTVRDVLNRDYRLVQVAPGNVQVYDPRTGEWSPYNEEDWSIAGQRRRRGG